MREYVLFSRTGQTDSCFVNLHKAGRLDIVYECILASLFQSHSIRKDVAFHAILNGQPNPPLHLRIDGGTLHDVRTDQETWTKILKNVLERRPHPGITVEPIGYETLIKAKAKDSAIYVLEERGKDIDETEIEKDSLFVLGDYIGLPKVTEKFTLRYGEKISLGKQQYLAAQCITILNYLLDTKDHFGG
jgi:tRNA (pseudouridine54-N1)-methyltransferase